MGLLVDHAGEELLGVAEHEGPGEDLGGGVQGAEAGDELASHEEEAEEGGDGAHGELEGGEGDGQAVGLGGAADAAQGGGGGDGGRGEADDLDDQEVGGTGGPLDDVIDVEGGRARLLAGVEQGRLPGGGQTTTVWPDRSGWKQSGTSDGLMNPRTAMPTAIRVITTEVTIRTLRKLRTRSCSRRAALLAARTLETIALRSWSVMAESSAGAARASLPPSRSARRSSSRRRGSSGSR